MRRNDIECTQREDIEKLNEETRPKPKQSFALLAGKISAAVLLFTAISVVAVTATRSFSSASSNRLSNVESFDLMGRVTYSVLTDEQQEEMFGDFITTYERSYAQDAEEYNKRLNVFKANLAVADVRNAAEAAINGTAVHGVTKFSDLTSEEFSTTYIMQTGTTRKEKRRLGGGGFIGAPSGSSEDPTLIFVDWSTSITTDIKNSGSCGGSWATAATEQIESDALKAQIITSTSKDSLSVQQILSCTPQQDGCTYGTTDDAYTYVQKPGGVYASLDYAYTSNGGSVADCAEPADADYSLTLGGFFDLNTDDISYNTERLMLAHLTSSGTLSACLDATTWSTYVSGTMSNCDGNEINHCVQLVGIYYSSAEDTGFYKVRNSWGSDWGVAGYISLAYGGDVCAVANNPSYTDPVKDSRR